MLTFPHNNAPLLFLAWMVALGSTVGLGQIDSPSWSRADERLRFAPLDARLAQGSSAVRDIIQDADGFIWFATNEGVRRFDTNRMRTFSSDKANPNTLVENRTLVFHRDIRGWLWIGTEKGVSRYLPETENFQNYLFDGSDGGNSVANKVNAFVSGPDNQLYASAESGFIYRYEEEGDRFVPINEEPLGLIKSMQLDVRGRFWVGCLGELVYYDPSTREVMRLVEPFVGPDPAAKNFLSGLLYQAAERLWIGTTTQGAALYNTLTGAIEFLPALLLGEPYVQKIRQDRFGNVWICHNGGVTCIEAGTDRLTRVVPGEREGSLPRSGIACVLVDEQENVWAGSEYHGIYVAARDKGFRRMDAYVAARPDQAEVVSALLHDSKGRLWIGRGSVGIEVIEDGAGEPKPVLLFANDPASIGSNFAMMIFEDSRGSIWIGSYRGGLQRYDEASGKLESYRSSPGDPNSIASNDVRGIQEDEKGNLWVLAHGGGLSYLDRASGLFTNYSRPVESSVPGLLDDWGNSLLYGSDRRVYVSTPVGLSVLDTTTGEFANYTSDPQDPDTLSSLAVNVVHEDERGRFWVGTEDGLNYWDQAAGRFVRYGRESGLPNPSVKSIAADARGRIWIGTNGGLARLDPETEIVRAYDYGDGLAGNEFCLNAVSKSRDGSLYFGQLTGLTSFDPEAIEDNTSPPRIKIMDFELFEKSLRAQTGFDRLNTLSRSILLTDEVRLDHEQKVLTIEFVALNYIQPEKNRFSYMLEGFDATWSQPGPRHAVTYTNLNPGSYRFKVKGSNNDGYWSPEPAQLSIVVLPPFWQTLWFRTLVGAALVSIPFALSYWRVRLVKAKKAELEAMVEVRTRDLRLANQTVEQAYRQLESSQRQVRRQNEELIIHRENLEAMVQTRTQELEMAKEKAERSDVLKSAFLANMSHEIRTPMNAIIGLLELLRQQGLSQEERDQYQDVIKQSGHTLLKLIDDILDLSRVEAGEATVHLEQVDVDGVCEELYALFNEVLKIEKGGRVALVLERRGREGIALPSSQRSLLARFDPVRLKQILTNLLSNASKFTDAGEVRFGYTVEVGAGGSLLRFFVQDTGIGIARDQIDRVFERFHKLEEAGGRRFRGTGLGLTISQKFAALMGGEITLESEEGRGSRFSVTFPLGPEPSGARGVERRLGKQSGGKSPLGLLETDLSGYSILVAEDEEPNYLFIRKTLELTGARATWAYDGERAIELFAPGAFDLVLLDLKMPRKDGYAALAHIRSLDTAVPVVVQTAYAMDGDRERAIVGGATDFLAKPYTPEQLVAKLLQNLSSPGM